MPGILPMKVIKVGSTSQSRIAQACDRCRSKKIRCDGVRPCCTQCANVGFECKTSDKLSRRAFPRGYTESLEERVRALESEVRDLKNLLDEKDEKIDVLSRIHSFSSSHQKSRSPSVPVKTNASNPAEDLIQVPQSSQPEETADEECAGVSSARGFSGKYYFPS
ncbi:DNA-binding transcription factor cat8 [Aspergillus melleus]|uniref:DNA-binding transcription factor cat8 n=1 Tax=Aspergillus melleus TaxID=138277 RepID=UPI001E8E440F|nr:DNA-binding transcription factor cat8 [Aspergillus melleus]KAH8426273.1 DNA-binding transcription factor cat8 [Aspergillus melleus]